MKKKKVSLASVIVADFYYKSSPATVTKKLNCVQFIQRQLYGALLRAG